MCKSSKLKDTHDLSVLGPNENRIPAARKRERAHRLIAGGDELGDDLVRIRRSTAVHEQSQIEYSDIRARAKRRAAFDGAQGSRQLSRLGDRHNHLDRDRGFRYILQARCAKAEFAHPAHHRSSLMLLSGEDVVSNLRARVVSDSTHQNAALRTRRGIAPHPIQRFRIQDGPSDSNGGISQVCLRDTKRGAGTSDMLTWLHCGGNVW